MVSCIIAINIYAGKRATIPVGAQSVDLDRTCVKKIVERISGLHAQLVVAPAWILAQAKLIAARRARQFRSIDVGETDFLAVTADGIAIMH